MHARMCEETMTIIAKIISKQSMDLASVQRRGFQGTGKQSCTSFAMLHCLNDGVRIRMHRSCIRQHAAATTALRFIAPCLHLDIQCIGSHFFGTGSGLHGAGIGDGRRLAGARRRELHLACRNHRQKVHLKGGLLCNELRLVPDWWSCLHCAVQAEELDRTGEDHVLQSTAGVQESTDTVGE